MHPENVSAQLTGENQIVGILVARTDHGNMHAGVAYQWRSNQFLYHQAFHYLTLHEPFDLGVERLGGSALVVALGLRRDRQKAIAGFLNSLNTINPQYPYSLKYDPKARIDRALGRLVTSEGKGLSCVTFVLAVFQSFSLRLVEGSTWPTDRPEDLEAQESLLRLLAGRVTAAHLEAVREEKGCMRIRPEEVGAAGYYHKWPVTFADAQTASLDLLKRIDKTAPTTLRGCKDTDVPSVPPTPQ